MLAAISSSCAWDRVLSELFDVLHGDDCETGGKGDVGGDVLNVRVPIDRMDGFSVRLRLGKRAAVQSTEDNLAFLAEKADKG